METASLAMSFILSSVFAVAGVVKLADLPGSRQAMRDFGVPEQMARRAGLLLPAFELVLAVGLLPATTAPWAAAGAFALLVAFTAAIGFNLARGRRPNCHCFGKFSASPIGRGTLARNLALAALAAFIVLAGRNPLELMAVRSLLSVPAWALVLVVWAAVLTVVAVAQGRLLFHLLRQHGRLLAALDLVTGKEGATPTNTAAAQTSADGLPLHAPAPGLTFDTLAGQPTTLTALVTDGHPAVLLFIDPNCGPCDELLPEARAWRQQFAHLFHLVAISRGNADANRVKTRGLANVWLQHADEALGAFRISGTPSAVVVAPDGRIASQTVGGADAIRQLVAATASASAAPVALAREVEVRGGARTTQDRRNVHAR